MIRKLLLFIVLILTTQLVVAQAPGDDCATAEPLPITPGTTRSTGFQTISAPAYNDTFNGNSCEPGYTFYGFGPPIVDPDGVYSLNVTIPGDYTFDFANNGTTWKSLSIHTACPPSNGADCLGGVGTNTNRDPNVPFTINLPVGVYYIVIDSYSPLATYPAMGLGAGVTDIAFELLITSPIANDECSGAIELFSSVDCSFTTFTTTSATASAGAPAPTCGNYLGGDIWFSYEVGPSGTFTVTAEEVDFPDGAMAIYTGACGSLGQVACNDDFFGIGSMPSITLTGRTPGEILYIRFWEWGNNASGDFDICITVPLPPGDNGVYLACPNERSLELTSDFVCPPGINTSSTVFGNLDGAAQAFKPNGIPANSPVCNFSTANRRYQEINFTVPTTGFYVIEATSVSGFDGMGYIVEQGFTPGVCASGTFVIVDDDSGPGNQPEVSVNLTAGVNYTLITTEYFGPGSGNSPYTWTVTSGPAPTGAVINWEALAEPLEWYNVASGGTPIDTGAGFDPINFPGSGLSDTSVPGVYTFWYACPSSPSTRTPVDYIIGKNWDGSVDGNWYEADNWTPTGVPTIDECVAIPDNGSVPNSPTADEVVGLSTIPLPPQLAAHTRSLIVQNDGYLEVAENTELVVVESVRVQGTGVLNLESSASLIQVDDTGLNTGNIYVQRSPNATATPVANNEYVYWSSPVANFPVTSVSPSSNFIYQWNPTNVANGVGAHGEWLFTNATMDTATGYIIRGQGGNPTSISQATTPTVTTYPVPSNTALFNGVPNNGVITKPIFHGGWNGGPYAGNGNTATNEDDNWNLIGNPYPSAISANAFVDFNTNINGTVYLWDHTTVGSEANANPFYEGFLYNYPSTYVSHNNTGSNPPGTNDLFIASGQAFFVLMNNGAVSGSDVTFNNSMRYDNTTLDYLINNYTNDAFYRSVSPESTEGAPERHRVWIDLLSPNDVVNTILVGYVSNATNEFDRLYDGYDFANSEHGFYSIVDDEALSIQGRALPFNEADTVPLGVVANATGSHTIAINTIDGLFLNNDQNIYLEDTEENIIHDLKTAPYTFTITQGIHNDRFVLRYTDDTLSISDYNLDDLRIIAPRGDYIKISSSTSPIDTIVVYDLLGRAIVTKADVNASEFTINKDNIASGAYLVKVALENGLNKTQKVVLKE